MKKIDRAAQLLTEHTSLFWCPVCQSDLHVKGTAMICTEGHQFDLAKKGYVNFYGKASPADYDRELFEARYQVIQSGMYDQLHKKIAEWIKNQMKSDFHMLDVGCGEGSHLRKLLDSMEDKATGVGIDIAKDGILTAAKYHQDVIWTVADLAKSPFQPHQFDVILNILSPANYQEFNRLLTAEGIVIKVIPNQDYLKEIREQVMEKHQHYSNKETLIHFKKHFTKVHTYQIHYKWKVPTNLYEQVWRMTPLTWGKTNKGERGYLTIDLTLLLGQK